MIDQINTLIEANLLLFLNAQHHALTFSEFKDSHGNKLQGAKILADIMLQKELIRTVSEEDFTYELTDFGKHIAESGGWMTLLKQLKHIENETTITEVKNPKHQIKKPNIELLIAGLIIIFLSALIVSCI